MMRFIMAIVLLTCSINASSHLVVLNELNEPPLTTSIKSQIENLNRPTLKEVHQHYRTQIGTVIEYLKLATGQVIEPPYTTITMTKRNYIDNIFSMKRTAAKIYPMANVATANAKSNQYGVKMMLSELVLNKGKHSCTANPIVETIFSSQVSTFKLTCELNKHPKEIINTQIAIGYGSDFKIRTADKELLNVDIFSNESRSTNTKIETYNNDINLTLKVTYKPID